MLSARQSADLADYSDPAEQLEVVVAHAETPRCRSAFILGYFGAPTHDRCRRCDNWEVVEDRGLLEGA